MKTIYVCTKVMYYIVGSHLRISLVFRSFLRGALGRFRRYNSGSHSITKKPTKNCRWVHPIEHTHEQLCTFHMYLGSVLYCRFSFTGQLDFYLFYERVLSSFMRYNSCTHSITKKPTKNCMQVHTIEDTRSNYVHQVCT